MAITENLLPGNDTPGPYDFTFKWLESTDIYVSVDGLDKTETTDYTLQGLNFSTKEGGQVLFTTSIPSTSTIRIYRNTDDTARKATFYPGSAIRSQDLNDNFTQTLYVAQETKNTTIQASTGNLADGSITSNLIADGSVTEAKLSFTPLKSTDLGVTVQAKYTHTTTAVNKTLVNGERCTVTAAGITVTLPASPSQGDEVTVLVGGAFTDTIVGRNGSNIMSLSQDLTIDRADVSITLLYVDATRGWRII